MAGVRDNPVNKQATSPGGETLARVLYFLLPGRYRSNVLDLLNESYRERLKEELPETRDLEKAIPLISARLKKIAGQPSEKGNKVAAWYLIIHLFFLIPALLVEETVAAAYLFTYGVAGFFYFRSRSLTYLKIRFSPFPVQLVTLVVSVLIYSALVLGVGSLSLGEQGGNPGVLMVLIAALFAPFFEEIFFRDLIFSLMKAGSGDGGKGGKIEGSYLWAILISSLLFTVVHISFYSGYGIEPVEFIIYFLSGLMLGSLKWLTKGLFYPVLVHAAANATILWL